MRQYLPKNLDELGFILLQGMQNGVSLGELHEIDYSLSLTVLNTERFQY